VKTAKAFSLAQRDSKAAQILSLEAERQVNTINLIASENHASRAVLEAQSSVLTDKYAEGYPGYRYYGGCVHIDEIENLAIERAKNSLKPNMPMSRLIVAVKPTWQPIQFYWNTEILLWG
jgi:Glycine/serine hydroxymethyltransferase